MRKRIRDLLLAQNGFGLMESMVAVAILGIIGVGFLHGLVNVSEGTYMHEKRATATSLAQSQVEFVKSSGYLVDGNYDIVVDPPAGYTVSTSTAEIETGKQEVTIEVSHQGSLVFTITTLKVDW